MITNFVKSITEHHVKSLKSQIDTDRERMGELQAKIDELKARVLQNESLVNETEAWLSAQDDQEIAAALP